MKIDISNVFPTTEQVPELYKLNSPIHQKEFLIGGEIRRWDGTSIDVYSPVRYKNSKNGEPVHLGSFPSLTETESFMALDAAKKAYDNGRGVWPTLPVAERIRAVSKFIDLMLERRDKIVKLIMWEVCKSLKDSGKEFDRTVQYLLDTIDSLKDLDRISSRFKIEAGIIGQIRRAPLGVALCMGPFNYPLNETFTTMIPALIMGNTVIFKPPSYGVLLHYPLLEAYREAFPPGVVNTVYGSGRTVIPPIMKSGGIDVLAFIGSSKVADGLKSAHPKPHRLRSCLGLEAKNAGIILPSADMDITIEECLTGTLSFNGQRCTALKTLFVHSSIADQFLEKFCGAISAMKGGMPWDDGVDITPLPEKGKTEWLSGLIKDAVDKGAKVVNEVGGTVNDTFMWPAVVYGVTPEMELYHEEQFGPVIPIVPFDDLETPVGYVEGSDFGQQVSIFGSDSGQIACLIDPLVNQVCRVNVNSQCQRGPDTFPFTGRKDSAEGTLSVSDALRVFSIRTLVACSENELNRRMIREILKEHKSNFLSTDFIL